MSKPPSAWKIEKALAIWREAMQDETGAVEAISEPFDILHALVMAKIEAGNLALVAAKAEASAKTRKQRFLAREDKMKALMSDLMDVLGIKEYEWGDVAVLKKSSPRSVVITDQSKLPIEYAQVTVTPDKRKIKADLEQGVVIEGAELSNQTTHIEIRTA